MKNKTQQETTGQVAPAAEAVLSRKELDHFFSVYFETGNICSKIREIKELPGDLTALLAGVDEKYEKVNFTQIDHAEYEAVKSLYAQTLELWNQVLAIHPEAGSDGEIKEITLEDVKDSLNVPSDDTPKRSWRGNLVIAILIVAVFGAIIYVTVPTPWMYNALGSIYYYGRGLDTDYEEAEKWFRKAAEKGYPKSQFNLALCYETGNGVEQDYMEAVKWYRKAAAQGLAKAQYALARCLEEGRGCERNYEEAVQWYSKAAEQGHIAAQYSLGVYYENNEQFKTAFQWYEKAAQKKYVKAMRALGYFYDNGLGIAKNTVEAEKYFRAAAEAGDAIAQYNLAIYCEQGFNNQKPDLREAAHWLRKSAQQDYPEAQYRIGRYYEAGTGVKPNKVEAIRWYDKAARAGHSEARAELVRLLGKDYFLQNNVYGN